MNQQTLRCRLFPPAVGVLIWLITLLTALSTSWPGIAQAQTSAAATAEGTATDTETQATPISEISEEAVSDLSEARRMQNREWIKDVIGMGAYQVPRLEAELQRLQREATAMQAPSGFMLEEIQRQGTALRELELAVTPVRRELARAAYQLERDRRALETLEKKWNKTASAAAREIPQDLLDRVEETRRAIRNAQQALQDEQEMVLGLQGRIADISSTLDELQAQQAAFGGLVLRRLFQRDSAPLWSRAFWSETLARTTPDTGGRFRANLTELNIYLKEQRRTLLLHGALTAVIIICLFAIRPRIGELSETDSALQARRAIFDMPIVTALLLGLLLAGWLYPAPPHAFTALLGLISAPPVYLFTRRLVERDVFPLFQIVIAFHVADWLRDVLSATPALARLMLMLEVFLLILFLLRFRRQWILHHAGGTRDTVADTSPGTSMQAGVHAGRHIGLVIAHTILLVAAGALVASIAGFSALADVLLSAGLSSAYVAVVLYAIVRAFGGVVRALLHVPPFSYAAGVRRYHELIAARMTRLVSWCALAYWVLFSLRAFGMLALVKNWGNVLWKTTGQIGSLKVSVSSILVFSFMLGATYLVAKLVQFLLEEEIFSRVQLDRGLPLAVSTTVRYLIIVLGFMLALSATGIDTTRFAIVAGALTVGIGFGLQNIVNNFVSGLIVLFERPVKAGDTIQLGDVVGRVRQIGIRATIIESTSGAAVIIPNAKLISDQVTNWTPTGNLRMISVPVVAKTDIPSDQVKVRLLAVADADDKLLDAPAPQVLLVKRNVDTLEYELRVWTHALNDWVQIRSDLIGAIDEALRNAPQSARQAAPPS